MDAVGVKLAAPSNAVPHSAQNFCVGVTGLLQPGQTSGSADPHSTQNFFPAGLTVPHRGQVTVACSMVPSSYHAVSDCAVRVESCATKGHSTGGRRSISVVAFHDGFSAGGPILVASLSARCPAWRLRVLVVSLPSHPGIPSCRARRGGSERRSTSGARPAETPPVALPLGARRGHARNWDIRRSCIASRALPFVGKEAHVTGQVRVGKQTETQQRTVGGDVRREQVEVEEEADTNLDTDLDDQPY